MMQRDTPKARVAHTLTPLPDSHHHVLLYGGSQRGYVTYSVQSYSPYSPYSTLYILELSILAFIIDYITIGTFKSIIQINQLIL